ncbi:hypothetical protein DAPPUDRAFT_112645 [Daphnia pulex]|uniref:Uncharacterized protein n=1 Tax=Daphnia pulex TaxID=6669 RepID=E9HCH7_DAPPU|nr:hypothetical protein DAPPUDRAFT_112645 [Daphnia pulex]|eukprot:EFX70531.1 hypothetical protein DAPPUDRAFT_112645 [Daphnia pulex]
MYTDSEIESILIAAGYSCRHRKRPIKDLGLQYQSKIRRKANHFMEIWESNGIFEPTTDEYCDEDRTIQTENDLGFNDIQSHRKPTLSLLALLQHFAVYTNQNHSDLTYLLMLLKFYEPEANYSMLPNTGKELVKIDGLDWQPNETETSRKLPLASPVGDGKYLHFGLESALSGTSPGIVYRDADLFQFVNVYVDDPHLLPKTIEKRIEAFDPLFTANLAQKRLLSENRGPVLEHDLPHYEVDVFIDESKPFRAKDAASVTPILGRIHSIRPNSESNEEKRENERFPNS